MSVCIMSDYDAYCVYQAIWQVYKILEMATLVNVQIPQQRQSLLG